MSKLIYTIGHSTHSLERLIGLLTRHEISAVADVRSQPYSRINPQFNRKPLQSSLRAVGIAYVFLGRDLGARSEDPSCYVNGKVQYDRLARSPLFQEGLTRIERGGDRHRIALLCAEKDPLTCHRTILVCRHLVARGIGATHILESGQLEPHDNALSRLLKEVGLSDAELFRTRDDLITEAYAHREQEIAYVERTTSVETQPQRASP